MRRVVNIITLSCALLFVAVSCEKDDTEFIPKLSVEMNLLYKYSFVIKNDTGKQIYYTGNQYAVKNGLSTLRPEKPVVIGIYDRVELKDGESLLIVSFDSLTSHLTHESVFQRDFVYELGHITFDDGKVKTFTRGANQMKSPRNSISCIEKGMEGRAVLMEYVYCVDSTDYKESVLP